MSTAMNRGLSFGKKLEKLVVNTSFGRLAAQPNFEEKMLPELIRDFSLITGQKPSPRPAKKSISGFKLRAGTIIGLTATLRGKRMDDFLRKLTTVVLPRIRDFRGVSLKNIDRSGNISIGIKDHVVFPEIHPESTKISFGLEITIVVQGIKNREEALALYRNIGVPFQKTPA